ncbi:MAG: hypothetical protein LBL30_00955 [Holosporales bacterium]|jgi:hypothetical protein|nr:hypothetical protein [Holosporales bacterium]
MNIKVWNISQFISQLSGECVEDEIISSRINALMEISYCRCETVPESANEWSIQFMERAPGVTLFDFFGITEHLGHTSTPRMGWPSAFPVMKKFGQAVRALNDSQIIHADLHFHNVFINTSLLESTSIELIPNRKLLTFIDCDGAKHPCNPLAPPPSPILKDRLSWEAGKTLLPPLHLCAFKEHAPFMFDLVANFLNGYNEGVCVKVELDHSKINSMLAIISDRYVRAQRSDLSDICKDLHLKSEVFEAVYKHVQLPGVELLYNGGYLLTASELFETVCKIAHEMPFLERPNSIGDHFVSSRHDCIPDIILLGTAFFDVPEQTVMDIRHELGIAPQAHHKWLFADHIDPEFPAADQ